MLDISLVERVFQHQWHFLNAGFWYQGILPVPSFAYSEYRSKSEVYQISENNVLYCFSLFEIRFEGASVIFWYCVDDSRFFVPRLLSWCVKKVFLTSNWSVFFIGRQAYVQYFRFPFLFAQLITSENETSHYFVLSPTITIVLELQLPSLLTIILLLWLYLMRYNFCPGIPT